MSDIRANLGAHRAEQPCEHCGAWPRKPHARSCPTAKRGRNNRARGNAYERSVAHRLNGLRIGQYGGTSDVRTDAVNVQVKVGSYFPERIWGWLDALPADGVDAETRTQHADGARGRARGQGPRDRAGTHSVFGCELS